MPSFTSHDGTDIVYDVAGTGPPVLLHHGFAADAQVNWVQPGIVDAISASGRSVITVDARGHGRSGKPHDPGAYAGLAMVDDVRRLLDHLDIDSVDVIGYSMGAEVTASLLGAEPRVRSAVLGGIGSQLLPRSVTGRAPMPAAAIAAALEAEDPSAVADAVPKAFRAFADSTGADRLALAAILRSRRAPPPELGDVAVPVLVISGDADDLIGDPTHLAAAVPGARVSIVSGDHLSAVFDPRFARELVDFLDSVASAALVQGSGH